MNGGSYDVLNMFKNVDDFDACHLYSQSDEASTMIISDFSPTANENNVNYSHFNVLNTPANILQIIE